jgi:integrase
MYESLKNRSYRLSIFDKLWLYSGNSKYLFPGRFNEDKPINKTSLAHAVRRITVVQEFTPRDLRRTVKTRMGEIGIEKSIRDRIQNHALTDVSPKHYDRYDYLPEKRAAILKWENHLLEVGKLG